MVKVKEFREKKCISRYQLTKLVNMNYKTLIAIEAGGDLRVSTLYKIANALECDVKDLLD